jgi:hypothetical protein
MKSQIEAMASAMGVCVHRKRSSFIAYGRQFDFVPGEHRSEAAAKQQAYEFSVQHIKLLREQKSDGVANEIDVRLHGAAPIRVPGTLTRSEQINGAHDRPPEEPATSVRKREQLTTAEAIDRIKSTPNLRKRQKDRRVGALERAQEKIDAKETARRRVADLYSTTQKAREHAAMRLEAAKADPKSTPADIRNWTALAGLADVDPASFWAGVDALTPQIELPTRAGRPLTLYK